MAGLYLLWAKGLARKAEVERIADATGTSRRWVAATLMEFWEWAEDQTSDGLLPGLRVRNLSALIADTSAQFWDAVVSVGWLEDCDGGIRVPKFERWMGRSSKRRLQEAERKRRNRQAPTPAVRKVSASRADVLRPQDKTRQEIEKNPLPPSLDAPEFRAAWSRWAAYRKERKKALTPSTEASQLKQLAAWGAARAALSIEQSIRQGWTGLFAPKEEEHGRPGGGVGRPGRVDAPEGKYDDLPVLRLGAGAGAPDAPRPPQAP